MGRRIQYYVDALDRTFAESRTPEEEEALVVSSLSHCSTRAAVAPMLTSATVSVFPRVPAGFVEPRGRPAG